MNRVRVAPLVVIASVLVASAGLAVLLGLDAAAEQQAGADRFAILLGSALGAIALTLAAITFFLIELQRRLARERLRSVQLLHQLVLELAEAVNEHAPAAPEAVPPQRTVAPGSRVQARSRARKRAEAP